MVSTDYINTGGGKLYMEAFVGGVLTGDRVYFGITENVNLTTATEYLEHKNTETSVTKTDKKVPKSVSATVTFGTAEISTKMLARAYAGLLTVKTQTVQTAQAVAIASVNVGSTYDLGYYNLTSVAEATYTEGTDYTVDMGSGMIEILEGGTIVDGTALSFTIDADAFTGSLMAGLKATALEAKLTFISAPLAGKRFKYTFKKVSISASGDLALKSEEFAVLAFEGTALADESITDPTLSDYFDVEEIA